MQLGLDYSSGRPRAGEVARAGYRFVARYLSYAGNPKDLTASEVADMQAYGIAIVLVFETTAGRAGDGFQAGVTDARAAQVEANSLGLGSLPIYMAVDYDVPDYAPSTADPRSKLGPVAGYLQGAVSVLGLRRTGVYGGYWTVSRALAAGLAGYAWQSVAWSGGQTASGIHLYQRAATVVVDGIQCDVNESRAVDFGQSGALTAGDSMTTFLYNSATGESATQDGPFVSGLATATAKACLTGWPGSCQIGLSQHEWDDRVAKSRLLEGVPGRLDAVAAAIAALPAALAAALPVAGGAAVSQQQLVDAIRAGVQAGMAGLTETVTIAKPAG
jgi:hypothetical protein